MPPINKQHLFYSLLLLFALLTACTPNTPTPTATAPLAAVPISTARHTATPSPTLSLTPSSTPEPTATETPLAIPTPPGTDLVQQVLWLYETNNNCQLPCWWGITPGHTQWQVAQEFFSRFDIYIYESTSTPGMTYYGPQIPLPAEIFGNDLTELGITVRNGIVDKSCSLITEVKIPEASRNANHVVIKGFFVITEAMNENVVSLQAANGILNQYPDSAQGLVIRLLLIGQGGKRVLLALARLFVG